MLGEVGADVRRRRGLAGRHVQHGDLPAAHVGAVHHRAAALDRQGGDEQLAFHDLAAVEVQDPGGAHRVEGLVAEDERVRGGVPVPFVGPVQHGLPDLLARGGVVGDGLIGVGVVEGDAHQMGPAGFDLLDAEVDVERDAPGRADLAGPAAPRRDEVVERVGVQGVAPGGGLLVGAADHVAVEYGPEVIVDRERPFGGLVAAGGVAHDRRPLLRVQVHDLAGGDEVVVERVRVRGDRADRVLRALVPDGRGTDAVVVDGVQALGALFAPHLLARSEVDADGGIVLEAVALLHEDVGAVEGDVVAVLPGLLPQQFAGVEPGDGAHGHAFVGGGVEGVQDEQVADDRHVELGRFQLVFVRPQ
ncbi:hypothetical protein QWI33_27375 [Glycomyces tritici]|uniref:Uncharacterized protein n=1 Tax=Glycomyces tritici TaxID=2665176 RepID=A0ABT7YXV8_9ACTN|nr:hypothetical protein [Glycomyces tritici]MDN3243466.1 hypothetical protein [Glycomyces tritici]